MISFPALALAAALGRPEVLVCGVAAEAERQGLDPVVVCALVEVESGWKVGARNRGGDYGLFQISERWHGRHEPVSRHIRKGCSILGGFIRKEHGDVARGLACYNAGRPTARGLRYARKVLYVAARARKALEAKVWHFECSLRLWQRDWWSGLWSVDYAPRKRRVGRGRA